MRALVQRVTDASVAVDGKLVASTGPGLVVFIGIASDDTGKDVEYIVNKVTNLRIFSDAAGKFNLSALDVKAELLIVSQFTLLADTRKGRRPSFTEAAPPDRARPLFEHVIQQARSSGLKVATGLFQEQMLVEIHNDGPVTVMLDSREKTALSDR